MTPASSVSHLASKRLSSIRSTLYFVLDVTLDIGHNQVATLGNRYHPRWRGGGLGSMNFGNRLPLPEYRLWPTTFSRWSFALRIEV